jgi:pilus assembly protein CpaC
MNNQVLESRSGHAILSAVLAMCLVLGAVGAHAADKKAAPPKKATPVQQSANQPIPCDRVDMGPTINVTVGKSTLVKLQTPITRIVVGNPDQGRTAAPIAIETTLDQARGAAARPAAETNRPGVADVDVVLLSPQEIYLLGKSIGSTNFVLVDRSGQCTVMDVIVGMDTAPLRASLTQLLPGERNVVVSAAADSLVLTGTVADAMKLDRVLDLANAYVRRAGGGGGGQAGGSPRVVNLLAVEAPQQVMLEVKVAEISKALVDKLGASLKLQRINGGWTYSFLGNFLSGTGGLIDAFRRATGEFITIDAENKDGLVKILAEPNLMAISGQEGSFLAGGKIFIPVSSSGTNGVITITLEEKEFGVGLRFTPTVLEGGRINLKVSPEVSELSREGVGVSAVGITGQAILPLITTRRASTTVQLMDGQSFAIGGLVKNNVTQNIRALPFLGEVPVLGALFRSTDFQTDKTELLFVVTPRLVKPLPADYRLPTDAYIQPTWPEAFLEGRMEGGPIPPPGEAQRQPRMLPPPANSPGGPSGFEVK